MKRMRTQSIGSVPLLLHKKQSVVAQEACGVTKAEGMRRGAPSPSFVLCELFRGKAASPACFIANASLTSKGPSKSWIRACALHSLTAGRRGGLRVGGGRRGEGGGREWEVVSFGLI